MNEELVTSGSVNFNIVRMVEDHVPLRIDEIEREIVGINTRARELMDERETLMRIMDALVPSARERSL
jgi:RecA/RadA recombinase